jgi:hypothetical protein
MKKIFTMALLGTFLQSQGQLILNESFNYPAGILAGNGKWYQSTAQTQAGGAMLINSMGLSYTGYPATGAVGACAQYTANTGLGDIVADTFASITDSFYCAFLVKVNAAPTATTNQPYCVTFSSGDFFTHAARLMLYKGSAANTVKFGVRKGGGGNPDVYDNTDYALNTTYLITMKFVKGTSTTDDVVKLYVNPTITTEPTTANAMQGSGIADFMGNGVDRIVLRNNGGASTPDALIDEIRIGKTWKDIFPDVIPNATKHILTNNFLMNPNPIVNQLNIISISASLPHRTLDAHRRYIFVEINKRCIY